MKTIYKSTLYRREDVVGSYLAQRPDCTFVLHAVNDKSQTLWSGQIENEIIPYAEKALAKERWGYAFNQVKMPHDVPLNFLYGVWP